MRRGRLILTAALLVLPSLLSLAGEPYLFRSIEVEDGLSQNTVYCVFQDSRKFMWFGTQDGLNRYDGSSFKVFKSSTSPDFGNDGVICLAEGDDDCLWVGTIDGLYRYSQESELFSSVDLLNASGERIDGLVRCVAFDPSGSMFVAAADSCLVRFAPDGTQSVLPLNLGNGRAQIRSLCPDREGNLWVATYYSGLIRIGAGTMDVERYIPELGREEVLFTKVVCLDGETLLLGTMNRGVMSLNLRTHQFSEFEGLGGSVVHFVHDIMVDDHGCIWVGAENGLHIYDSASGSVSSLSHIPNNPYSISDNAIFSIAQDMDGGVWIGSYFGGVNYYSSYSSQFKKYYPVPGQNDLTGKNVSEFCEDASGLIWLGTEDAGLFCYDPGDDSFKAGNIPASNVHALFPVDGKLWVGTYGDGLFILDPRTSTYRQILLTRDPSSLQDNNIYTFCRDGRERMWIGTERGLYRNSSQDGLRKVAADLIVSQVNDILCDFYGNLWVATMSQGLFFLPAGSDRWSNPDLDCSYLTCIMEDSDHDIWLGSKGNGIFVYNHVDKTFSRRVTTADGLPDDMVYKLLEDTDGAVWGSTNHGLFRISPEKDKIVCFDHHSGLVCDQFNFNSGFRSSDGHFYFGGVKGFVSFDPEAFSLPAARSNIVFNRLLIFNNEAEVGGKDSPLKSSITRTDHITLKPWQSVFSIGFADLNFAAGDNKTYQYQLAGHNNSWINIEGAKLITFSNIPSGNYRLDVRANPLNTSAEEPVGSISITILPPWYRTLWAKFIYLALLIALIYGLIRLFRYWEENNNRSIVERIERQKEKEIYDAKIGFFTHITHEIRTPLTLITVPMEEIMKQTEKGSPTYEDLSIVQRNSNRLLTLVNELLDFKQAGVNEVQLNFIHTDIVSLIDETIDRFTQLAQSRGLTITRNLPESLVADADREILTKILSNILNNACKHAASSIAVSLTENGDRFRLAVANDGDSIPADKAEAIFDPFVKLDDETPGSGIGLPFARSLAKTHNGNIFLDQTAPVTTFVLDLPLVQENAFSMPEDIQEPVMDAGEPAEDPQPVGHGRRVLVVDDNEDFLTLLKRSLSSEYEVVTASDGKAAMTVLDEGTVDLVVTDLMMPGVDGKALCAHIREDFSTSHIPVILLTARSDLQTRLECLKLGVDEYITKPFSADYLRARIDNLLSSRETLRTAFQHSPDIGVESIAPSKTDSVFLEKVTAVIAERMENPNLDVDEVAAAVNMSRATLYRKMKSVTDLTPNDYIRLCRLKKAARLLEEAEYQVNEIAYIVGFSSVSYFSKCFSKQFGVSPKDYRR